ncbi:ribbon-helix-helix protein, CopG family [Halobaculum sp. D14]|uniref:CopG family ribbon-helix-helix protein n=1 Tax=Halobaculum sp. D14 TaxID=3421642 RepID=UPI003EBC0DFB
MTVVSVSMPEELVDRLDRFADEHGYTGRSELLREAGRNLLGEFEDRRLEERELMAVVTVVFDYETTNVEERMMHLRHENEHLVASNFHSHVGGHLCMELFVLDGDLEEISSFVGKIRATRDTLSVDYSVMPVDDFGVDAAADEASDGDADSDRDGDADSDRDADTDAAGRDD